VRKCVLPPGDNPIAVNKYIISFWRYIPFPPTEIKPRLLGRPVRSLVTMPAPEGILTKDRIADHKTGGKKICLWITHKQNYDTSRQWQIANQRNDQEFDYSQQRRSVEDWGSSCLCNVALLYQTTRRHVPEVCILYEQDAFIEQRTWEFRE